MPNSFFKEKDLDSSLCIGICEDQRNPELINSPISISLQSGEMISTKLCRNCLFERLCYLTESYYSNTLILSAPDYLYPIHSDEFDEGTERWPQIPFGQLITVLINNKDDKLSSMVTAYLITINDYAIRNKMKYHFTFCPDHPKNIINVKECHPKERFLIKCKEKNCRNTYCQYCYSMHNRKVECDLKTCKNLKVCPGCSIAISKGEGCYHMKCICGTIFCYKCLNTFDTGWSADEHYRKEHMTDDIALA